MARGRVRLRSRHVHGRSGRCFLTLCKGRGGGRGGGLRCRFLASAKNPLGVWRALSLAHALSLPAHRQSNRNSSNTRAKEKSSSRPARRPR
jgi:hypothetical protein